jgi:hypothetical protein
VCCSDTLTRMNFWVAAAATLVFLWGVWDYFHFGRHSSTAYAKALVGLGAGVLTVVRTLL